MPVLENTQILNNLGISVLVWANVAREEMLNLATIKQIGVRWRGEKTDEYLGQAPKIAKL